MLDQDALLFAPPALEEDDPGSVRMILGYIIWSKEPVARPHRQLGNEGAIHEAPDLHMPIGGIRLGSWLIAFGLEASPLPLQAIAAPSANPHSLTTLISPALALRFGDVGAGSFMPPVLSFDPTR